MKPLIAASFSLLLLAACNSGASGEKDCAAFKTGDFRYAGSDDIRVVRTDSIQTEYSLNPSYRFTDKYRIGWEDNCTYFLTLLSTDRPEGLDFGKDDTLWVKIDRITRKGYTFVAMKKGATYKGELIKTE